MGATVQSSSIIPYVIEDQLPLGAPDTFPILSYGQLTYHLFIRLMMAAWMSHTLLPTPVLD